MTKADIGPIDIPAAQQSLLRCAILSVGSTGKHSETARFHLASRQRGGGVAARARAQQPAMPVIDSVRKVYRITDAPTLLMPLPDSNASPRSLAGRRHSRGDRVAR